MNDFICPITNEQHSIGESYKEILSVDKVFNVKDNVRTNGIMYWEKDKYNGYLTIRRGLTWNVDVAIELRKHILSSIEKRNNNE